MPGGQCDDARVDRDYDINGLQEIRVARVQAAGFLIAAVSRTPTTWQWNACGQL
jgi:hypothetical protein